MVRMRVEGQIGMKMNLAGRQEGRQEDHDRGT
jgi:hypothetical protein